MDANRSRLPNDLVLPGTGMTLKEARDDVTSRHFAKELMGGHERSLLYITEALLRLADPASYGITKIERLGGKNCDWSMAPDARR